MIRDSVKLSKFPKFTIIWQVNEFLTMQFLPGYKINDVSRLKAEGIDLNRVNEEIYKIFMEMIYNHGHVHCDPHPGNILINQDKATGELKLFCWITEFINEFHRKLLKRFLNCF